MSLIKKLIPFLIVFGAVTDLDNPLKPGDWHITTKDYKALLAKIG